MKESALYWNFLKRNILIILAPVVVSLLISIFFYSKITLLYRVSQSFRMEYSLENVEVIMGLTDQAVTELRVQKFENNFAGAKTIIYKGAPLEINIEAVSPGRNQSFELLLKEVTYLRKNFSVSELTQPEVSLIEPNAFKYFLAGILPGFLTGFIIALMREYFKNY